MTVEAYQECNWQQLIAAHHLESHDHEEWLRYGVSLLNTLTPGPDIGQQLQQAALAFVQASKEGATASAVAAAQEQSVLLNLQDAIEHAGITRVELVAHEQAAVSSSSAASPEPDQQLMGECNPDCKTAELAQQLLDQLS